MRTRSAAKHEAMIDAAIVEFLDGGFVGASMDQIADRADVSKRTLYDHFGDKEQLFEAAIDSMTANAAVILAGLESRLETIDSLEGGVAELAVDYALRVLDSRVIRLRRLMIREADRFPDLASRYHDRGPRAAISAVAAGLARLQAAGSIDPGADLHDAAADFAYLVLGQTLDEVLFHPASTPDRSVIERRARAAAATWVRAYGRPHR